MTETALDAEGLIVEAQDAIFTHSGKTIRPLHPDPADIDIRDIAHALSQQCRFTGHTKVFFSVAEHSLRVSQLVPEELALEALLHDASEAYLSDIARPIKQAPDFAFYKVVERRLEQAIAERFSLPAREEMHPSIRWADQYALEAEVGFLHHPDFQRRMEVDAHAGRDGKAWLLPAIPAAWPSLIAKAYFLERFELLGGVA